jgi:hypothetical protein
VTPEDKARFEEALKRVDDALARLRRIEAMVEKIAQSMGIAPYG